jgi:crotonobetainyl-CoA:carnitine CoA-transferase CaiB-like acyl-CoA transferase
VTNGGGSLEGLRVLDLGQLIQGPQAALLLADLGADVIKVELPGRGDLGRATIISREDRRSPFFIACNRGKRGITLDLRKESGKRVFLRLVDSADVLISNFVPGTLEGWGLGYEALAERNPRLVFATGSTYGPVGPDSALRGADLAGQAAGGLIRRTGPTDLRPVGAGIADHLGSQNMANGILAALLARGRTGRGQRVDVSLLGAVIFAQASEYTYTLLTGREPGETDRSHPLLYNLYGVVPTSDGHVALVGVLTEQLASFFETVGRPDLARDPRFSSGFYPPAVKGALLDELAGAFRTRTTAEWIGRLRAIEVRCAPVRDYLEVVRDEGVFANAYLQRFEDRDRGEQTTVGCPIRLSDTPARPGRLAPAMGQHTEEVLLELGLASDEIATLRAERAI